MIGWVKIHKKLFDWEWYTDANTFRLYIHCLLKANHKDKYWRNTLIKRGSFVTGLNVLSAELDLSVQQIRTSIIKLESTNNITSNSTNKNRLITIVKYDDYQLTDKTITSNSTSNQQTNEQANNRQTNKQITATKNIRSKEVKNIESNIKLHPVKSKDFPVEVISILNNIASYFPKKVINGLSEKQKDNWKDCIFKLNTLDKYSFPEIEKMIIWGRTDDFWKSNFLSILKLRKKDNEGTKYHIKFSEQMNKVVKSKNEIQEPIYKKID